MMTVDELVARAQQDGASSILLLRGLPPKYRRDGQLRDMDSAPLTAEDCAAIARFLCGTEENYRRFMDRGELDTANVFAGTRCRVHVFKQMGCPSAALRLLRGKIPPLEILGLPPAVQRLTEKRKGIILVTGESGSGKSTTLAALVDSINHRFRSHIVTIEDPVEYIYTPDLCAITQREVGRDTESFAEGLRASLREDPNVILVGELRDRDAIKTAITAAETGHLVFAPLYVGSAVGAADHIVQFFPADAQAQIRLQLSTTLEAVLTQQLLPRKGGGRVLAAELMLVTDAIRNLIRLGNTPQIANAIATSAAIGGQTMDQSLVRLFRSGAITRETAVRFAHDAEYVKKNVM